MLYNIFNIFTKIIDEATNYTYGLIFLSCVRITRNKKISNDSFENIKENLRLTTFIARSH